MDFVASAVDEPHRFSPALKIAVQTIPGGDRVRIRVVMALDHYRVIRFKF